MKPVISVYGDMPAILRKELQKEISDFELNIIKKDDIHAFDDAIYQSHAIIMCPTKGIPFISAFGGEWRFLKPELQKNRPVIIFSEKGDILDITLEFLKGYRKNLPDEKNPEAKNWFLYPTKKIEDFFTVTNDLKEIAKILKSKLEKVKIEIKPRLEVPKEDLEKLKIKFPNGQIYDTFAQYSLANKDRKPGILVMSFANGNTYLDELCEKIGKFIAEAGYRLINGRPDGETTKNGPMRASSLSAQKYGAPILSIYSSAILENYSLSSSEIEVMSVFDNISVIPVREESQRKEIMLRDCSAVFVLPGAIGTMAEVEDALRRGKPVVFIDDKKINNGKGFWLDYVNYLKKIGYPVTLIYNDDNLFSNLKNFLDSCSIKEEKPYSEKLQETPSKISSTYLTSSIGTFPSAGYGKNQYSSSDEDLPLCKMRSSPIRFP